MLRKNFATLLLLIGITIPPALKAQQWGNYTLYSTMSGTMTYLIDTNSANVHTWTHTTATKTGYSSYLLPGGTLLRTVAKSGNSFSGGPICGQVQKVDWSGNVTWNYIYSTTQYCTHHDIHPMPNGNVLLIAYERKTATEVSAAGCTQSMEMWPDKIVEVEPVGATGGNIVWEWHAWDHLVQNFDPTKPNYQTSIVNHPELLNINYNTAKDWMHMNGVSYNPMLNQISFSCHNLNEIYVIDHSTTTAQAAGHTGGNSGKGGDILYRWGNPAAYSASGAPVFNVVHDAHWNPEGVPNAGYLGGYNNKGISSSPIQSCADQVAPPYNGYNYSITPGSAFLPATYTLRQATGGGNSNMGSYQVLPNGNMLLSQATAGTIKEFDPAGNLIWSKTVTGAVPKAFRYDSCYVYNPAPAIPAVSLSADTLYSTAGVTYQWYYNGYLVSGANSNYFVLTQTGNYKVRITDVNGCVYQYSPDYYYTVPTGINENHSQGSISIYPNPSTGIININVPKTTEQFELVVTDQIGNIIINEKNKTTIDLSKYENGVYFITVNNVQIGRLTQKITLIK